MSRIERARRLRRAALPALALLACAPALATAQAAAPDPAAVDRFLRENLERTGLPGVAVAIVSRGGAQVTAHGHDSEGRPLGPDTPMRVGSLSKSFTALAVMQLVEGGRVQLDCSIAEYLPEFEPLHPRGSHITVRQLLNQSSGMSDDAFAEMTLPQPTTTRQAVERMGEAWLAAEPGEEWIYHNPNYHLLARLIEVAGGMPYADYMRTRVFEPMGMTRTYTVMRASERQAGLADGYTVRYGFPVARPIFDHWVAGSGGVVSTARDMATWLRVNLDGGVAPNGRRVISAESLRAMHAPSAPGEDYGFGWETDRLDDGSTRVEHGGLLFTFSANQQLYPAAGIGIAVLFNSATPTGAEQMSFIDGVEALARGREPEMGSPVSRIVDGVIALLTVISLLLGIRRARRAREWARRWAARPGWARTLRLIAGSIPAVICLFLPTLAGLLLGGRDVTWTSAVFAWPALVVWSAVAAASALTVLAFRLLRLREERRRSSPAPA
ncbi:MAG TPA: serine hydrolase domain-containing protein [Longimicrobium sp.]|nr:serine hydrolase domain-containing protein [Longimicrobium sp.]